MKSKTFAITFCLLILTVGLSAQPGADQNSNIPIGYNKKYVANTEKNWDKKRIKAFVVDKDGNTYQGQLFNHSDQKLYFYASDTLFYKNPDKNLIYSFSPDEIQRIVLKRSTLIREGIIAGAITALAAPIYATIEFVGTGEEGWLIILIPALYLGGAIMMVPAGITAGYIYGISIDYQTNGDIDSYKILSEELSKFAMFKNEIPESFLPSTETTKKPNASESLSPYKERSKNLLGYNKWDIGVSIAPVFSSLSDDFKRPIGKNLPQDYNKSSDYYSPSLGLDIGYRIKNNTRLGFEISGYSYSLSYENIDYENYLDPYTSFWLDYTLTSFALNLDYIYKPVRRLMSRRNEFSFGFGASANLLSSYITEDYYTGNSYTEPNEIETDPTFNAHINASIGYDLYIFSFLSAKVALQGNYAVKEMETAGFKLTDFDNIEYTIPESKINTSSVMAEFGFRLHF